MAKKSVLKRAFYKQEFLRNVWMPFMAFICLAVMLPIRCYNLIEICKDNQMIAETVSLQDRIDVLNGLYYQNIGVGYVLAFLAVVSAVYLFSFLSSKKKMDFYYGQPVKKSSLFWCNYLQGFVYLFIPYLICNLLVILIALANGYFSFEMIGIVGQQIFNLTLFYMTVYTMAVVACCLTGNLIFSVLGTGVLMFYFPLLIGMLQILFEGHLSTHYEKLRVLFHLSPIVMMNEYLFFGDSLEGCVKVLPLPADMIILMSVMFLVSLGAAYYLFHKRDEDAVGNTVVFKKASYIIKALLVSVGTLTITIMFGCFFDSHARLYKITGFVAGVILTLYVVDCMMDLSFTSFFEKWKKQWSYILVSLAVTAGAFALVNSCRYRGFDEMPKLYTEEDAKADGCVLIRDFKMKDNLDVWNEFVEKVEKKQDCKVRMVNLDDWPISAVDLSCKDGKVSAYTSYNQFEIQNKPLYLVKLDGNIIDRDKSGVTYIVTDLKKMTFDDYISYSEGNFSLNHHYVRFIGVVSE